MTTSSADDFLTAGNTSDRNSASFSFATPGTVVSGTVAEIGEQVQQTAFGTGVPKVDKKGNAVMMLPVTLQTDLRNWADATNPPTDDHDNVKEDVGLRTIWLRYKLRDAVIDAVGKAGAKLRIGGVLAARYTESTVVNGYNVKEYEARYTPPSAADNFLNTPAPALAAAGSPVRDSKGWDASPPF